MCLDYKILLIFKKYNNKYYKMNINKFIINALFAIIILPLVVTLLVLILSLCKKIIINCYNYLSLKTNIKIIVAIETL
jgi:hypothetical protein